MILEADLHTHTVASKHAYSTITENVHVAAKKGLKLIAMTDHGPAMPDGGHHEYFFSNMRVIPEIVEGVRVLKGVEANILDCNGNIDLPIQLLEQLDIVLAGFHDGTGYSGSTVEENTRAMINAIKNPYVHLISHPGNPTYPVDYEKIVLAAKIYGKALEVNNSSLNNIRPGSSLNCSKLVALAAKHKIRVAVSSDAHYCQSVGNFARSLYLVEKYGLSPDQVLNSSAAKVMEYLENLKANRVNRVAAY